MNGNNTGMVLDWPDYIIIEKSLKFEFKANNNQVEYEALIPGMLLTLEVGASKLKAKNDSQLFANQVSRQYQIKEPNYKICAKST